MQAPQRMKAAEFFAALRAKTLKDPTIVGGFASGWRLMAEDATSEQTRYISLAEAKRDYARSFRTMDTAAKAYFDAGIFTFRVVEAEQVYQEPSP